VASLEILKDKKVIAEIEPSLIKTNKLTPHFTSALRAKLPKPNIPRKAPIQTKPCPWRLVEMVVSWSFWLKQLTLPKNDR